jgi:AMP nucleosidase
MPSAASLAHVDALEALYRESVTALRAALSRYIADGVHPDLGTREAGAFCYPELRLRYDGERTSSVQGRAFGRLHTPGDYAISVTQPELFRDYIAEQLDYLIEDYGATISIGRSPHEIPYPYVLDAEIDLTGAAAVELARIFPSTDLQHIGDEIADGTAVFGPGKRGRSHCSRRHASISASRGCAIIPARRRPTSRSISCSPTIIATSTSSCTGPARN